MMPGLAQPPVRINISGRRDCAPSSWLTLVRAANSGISAVVDPYGRILTSLAIGEKGVLDSPLPKVAGVTWRMTLGSLAGWLSLDCLFHGMYTI